MFAEKVIIMKGPKNEAAAATKSTVLLKLALVKGHAPSIVRTRD